MDSEQFDRLISSMGQRRSRRGVVQAVAATLGLGGLSLLGLQDSSAKKRKGGGGRRGKVSPPVSPPAPVNVCPVASVCNTAPNVCGTTATGEECSCELTTEGTNVCVNSGE